MHVIIATDGSRESLAAARHFQSFADPGKVTALTVLAVIRPLAAVSFANELSEADRPGAGTEAGSFRDAARSAVDTIAAELRAWGPKVKTKIRSGSPASEIIKEAELTKAGLIVVSAGGRGLTDAVLVGSTAQRVQHYAPCPVLVVRRPATKRASRP
ncbi:MAG: universal stress protein, partial [Nocardioides sp.]